MPHGQPVGGRNPRSRRLWVNQRRGQGPASASWRCHTREGARLPDYIGSGTRHYRDWGRHRVEFPPAGLFGTGQTAFIAAFPEQPSLATWESPNKVLGDFEPGVRSEVQAWGSPDSPSFVEVSSFSTFAQALADLVKIAKLHHLPVSVNRGVASTRIIWHVHDPAVEPWSIAVVEARGVEVFYALGQGSTYASANLLPSSFRLPTE